MNTIFDFFKSLRPVAAAFLPVCCAFSATDTFAGGPHLDFSPDDTIDFGKFEGRHVQTGVIYVKNTGDEPLEILKTFRGCSCTSLDYSHAPIAPGDSIPVTVTLNARSRKPGLIRKSIRVTTNAENPVGAIFIRGEVARPFQGDN